VDPSLSFKQPGLTAAESNRLDLAFSFSSWNAVVFASGFHTDFDLCDLLSLDCPLMNGIKKSNNLVSCSGSSLICAQFGTFLAFYS